LTSKLAITGDPTHSTVVTWDPYKLKYYFCPGITLDPSPANRILGFPEDAYIVNKNVSDNPPILNSLTCINLFTSFTMNNIPISHYLACVPVNAGYGSFIYFSQYQNDQSTLILDAELSSIRLTLQDPDGNLLEYPDNLTWEATLAIQSVIPEGFQPLEA
jgi:hypothetical protein